MTIALNIMRTTPISQNEFVEIVKNDLELSFLTENLHEATGRDFILRHHDKGNIEVELGSGNFQHPSAGIYAVDLGIKRTDENITKLVTIAERLNARLWQDVGSSFYRNSNGVYERYKDELYYSSAVINNSRENLMSSEQMALSAYMEKRGRIVAICFFCMSFGGALYFGGLFCAIILLVPSFFSAGILGSVFARNTCKMYLSITYFSFLLLVAIIIIYSLYFLFTIFHARV